ncbi:MAG: DUF6493 family protein [Bacteroidota bacterium]
MLEKELEAIVLQEKDIIPFLKKLSPEDKRALVPFLKKFQKKIFEQEQINENTRGGTYYRYKDKFSETKKKLVTKACYVCFNKKEAEKAFFNLGHLSVSEDYVENIIPWYKPKWYSDIINKEMPWGLSYEEVMTLYKKGFLQPSQDLLRDKLSTSIVARRWEKNLTRNVYQPEVLLKHKETLEEHFWYLFEGETNINNTFTYIKLDNYEDSNEIWIDTINDLINAKRLDRERVLRATIYTATKGFNKTLSGWFFSLLVRLDLSKEEVINLQNEFFAALNSPHSKVVNTVLKYFKSVANDKQFKQDVFIENASILLNSETKSVVNSTLMILEKIAKSNKALTHAVCKKAAEALINTDEKIQLRAAKIINKYGDPQEQELLEELSMYTDHIFHSSKELLKDYMVTTEEIEEEVDELTPTKILAAENKLPTYESLDELIFFVSQSIDNNEVYHIDFLLSLLPQLNRLLNKENVSKLEPLFKRAMDLSTSFSWNSQIGGLEREAAHFINDYAVLLMEKYPVELASFKASRTQKIEKLKEERYTLFVQNFLKQIEDQPISDHIYQVHRSLFIKSKKLIKKDLALGLLSAPTHAPCWIDPQVLIHRIIAFEKSNEAIDLFDFQIAIGRLPIEEAPEGISQEIDRVGDENIRNVLKYHYDLIPLQSMKISRPELWLQSVLSKNRMDDINYFQELIANPLRRERGAYEWECAHKEFTYREYDYTSRKNVLKKGVRKELMLKDFYIQKIETESIISSIKGVFSKKKKPTKPDSFYDYIRFRKAQYYITIQPKDELKFLFLSPNNPGMFLSQVIHANLKESTFDGESAKKNMVNLLQGLHDIWYRQEVGESTYLFLATGLLCSDKVARELAAEIWIKTNTEGKIDHVLLGQMLGKLEEKEYAPLKRFTDLLTANLFNVSKKHNAALYQLLDAMIGQMNDVPIRGVKKLLVIFLELQLGLPQIEMSQACREKLTTWKEIKSFKAMLKNI